MSNAFPRALCAALLAALACLPLAPASAVAQSNALTVENDSRTAIRTGVEYERSRQWLKAIRHYKAAQKKWPKSDKIRYGLRRSKVHFAISRRYLDRSFERKLLTKSKSAALDTFDEVHAQVRNNYVESLGSTSFVAHGTESLYLALVNQRFQAKHLKGVDKSRIARLRKILREQYWNKPVANRYAARNTVSRVCDLAYSTCKLPASAVVMEYVFGGCNALDDYSNVLSPDRLQDLYGNIDGNFVGLGIEMKSVSGKGLLLVNVLPKSPALESGLKRGEHIVEIDGRDCRKLTTDESSRMLRGVSGSQVKLKVESADGKQIRQATVTRRAVTVDSIPVAEIVDRKHGIGYIQMLGFQKTSASELDRALHKLNRQGMKSLIWDVRGNPGGLLTAATEVLDRFLSNGTLVSTKGRTRDQNWSYSATQSGTWNIPIVLLVDGDSASASEIVAGAIRDHKRGTIVGRQTFGKWSVQSIFPMNDKLGFRLTTAKFYSPHGYTHGKVGVKPHVVVKYAPKHLLRYRAPANAKELNEDGDLVKGIEILRKKTTQASFRR